MQAYFLLVVVDRHADLCVVGYRPAGDFAPVHCQDSPFLCFLLCQYLVCFRVRLVDEILGCPAVNEGRCRVLDIVASSYLDLMIIFSSRSYCPVLDTIYGASSVFPIPCATRFSLGLPSLWLIPEGSRFPMVRPLLALVFLWFPRRLHRWLRLLGMAVGMVAVSLVVGSLWRNVPFVRS